MISRRRLLGGAGVVGGAVLGRTAAVLADRSPVPGTLTLENHHRTTETFETEVAKLRDEPPARFDPENPADATRLLPSPDYLDLEPVWTRSGELELGSEGARTVDRLSESGTYRYRVTNLDSGRSITFEAALGRSNELLDTRLAGPRVTAIFEEDGTFSGAWSADI